MHCSQPTQHDHQSLTEIQNNVYFSQDNEQATSCRAVTDDAGSKDDITGHDGNDDNDDDDEVSAMSHDDKPCSIYDWELNNKSSLIAHEPSWFENAPDIAQFSTMSQEHFFFKQC